MLPCLLGRLASGRSGRQVLSPSYRLLRFLLDYNIPATHTFFLTISLKIDIQSTK